MPPSSAISHQPSAISTPAPLLDVLLAGCEIAAPDEVRSYAAWCEEELVMPSGPREGLHFSGDYMPWTKLLLAEYDNPRWRRFFVTGPAQSGKTMLGFVGRLIYEIFELRHHTAIGAPSADFFWSKVWGPKVRQVLSKTKYIRMLPRSGPGSRGGKATSMEMANGVWLYVMGAGGDSDVTSLTAQVLIVTELDQLGDVGEGMRGASPINQMESRLQSYGDDARVYGECVVHTRDDLIWHEVNEEGSGGRVFIRCPHCGVWIWPAREHLRGPREADTVLRARKLAGYVCQECGCLWSEADRTAANAEPRLVHRGQSVNSKGGVTGPMPPTLTLGFQYNGMHMHRDMLPMAKIADQEFRALESGSDEDDKVLHQDIWNIPWEPEGPPEEGLTAKNIRRRTVAFDRHIVPASGGVITVGVDLGKHACHWRARLWTKGENARGLGPLYVFDYGVIEVPQGKRSPEEAILGALKDWRDDVLAAGWVDVDGKPRYAERVGIDSGAWPEAVYEFCRDSGLAQYFPTKGWGSGYGRSPFRRPHQSTRGKVQAGNEWFRTRQSNGIWLLNMNVDHWKRREQTHWRIASDRDKENDVTPMPGGCYLWSPSDPRDHHTISQHIVAEREVLKEVVQARRKVTISVWERKSGNNHYLDAGVIECVLADMLGYRMIGDRQRKVIRRAESSSAGAGGNKKSSWPIGR